MTKKRLRIPPRLDIDPTVARLAINSVFDDEFSAFLEVDTTEAVKMAQAGITVVDRGGLQTRLEVDGKEVVLMDYYINAPPMIRAHNCACVDQLCPHKMAAALVWAWSYVQDFDVLLQTPLWRLMLGGLMRAAPKDTPKAKTQERFQYTLRDIREPLGISQSRKLIEILGIKRWRTRTSELTGKTLKPVQASFKQPPGAWGMQGTEADDEIARVVQVGTKLVDQLRGGHGVIESAELDVTRHLLFSALSKCERITLGAVGGPEVSVELDPIKPVMQIEQRGDDLKVSWSPDPIGVYPADPPWMLTQDLRFSPLDGQIAETVRQIGGLPVVPRIPSAQVPDFISEALPTLQVAVDLSQTDLVATTADAPMHPQVILTETKEGVDVDLRALYRYQGAEAVISASAPGSLITFDVAEGPQLVQRQREAEQAAAERIHRWTGPLPARLVGERAFDFMFDGLIDLQQAGFELRGDTTLAGKMVRTPLTSRVKIDSGIDWFELEVSFEAEGVSVPLKALMAARRAGRRYHRLSSGRVVRLPEAWLARHGVEVEALEDLRGRRKRIGAFAAPLVGDLVDEAGEQIAEETRANLKAWRERVTRLSQIEGVPARRVPKQFQGTLRDYQQRGFRWLTFLKEIGFGGVLADDMGLGKTVQVLAALQWIFNQKGRKAPVLVVAPTSVVHNWAREAARFTPELKVKVHHGRPRDEDVKALRTGAQLVVTSYPILRQDAELIGAVKWGALVLDEAQAIKNPSSQLAQTVRGLKAGWRLALTGTPLENDLFELWSLFEALMPGFFGSQRAFRERFAKPIHKDQDEDAMSGLRRRVRPFILRRLKSEVALELPPKTEQILYCELPAPQRRVYEGVKEAWRDRIMSSVASKGMGRSSLEILEALMRLRQAACDVALLPVELRSGADGSAKLDLLEEILNSVVAEGHKALIFSQWPSLLRRVVPRLSRMNVEHLYLDGGTRDRQALIDRFEDIEGPPIFLISLKAGGTGLNLTAADHVIHLDPWWNPAAEAQATDRVHRMGQTKPVTVYKLVARETVEEKIIELQDRKRALFEAAVDEGRVMVDALSQADLEAVFEGAGQGGFAEPLVSERAALTAAGTATSDTPLEQEGAKIVTAPSSLVPHQSLPPAVRAILSEEGSITSSRLSICLGCSTPTARARLKGWAEKGWLRVEGRGRGTRYVMPD
ncbi:MAG: SNF2-related protein [Bradymonadia bacterium]